jgi:hypothetical protein
MSSATRVCCCPNRSVAEVEAALPARHERLRLDRVRCPVFVHVAAGVHIQSRVSRCVWVGWTGRGLATPVGGRLVSGHTVRGGRSGGWGRQVTMRTTRLGRVGRFRNTSAAAPSVTVSKRHHTATGEPPRPPAAVLIDQRPSRHPVQPPQRRVTLGNVTQTPPRHQKRLRNTIGGRLGVGAAPTVRMHLIVMTVEQTPIPQLRVSGESHEPPRSGPAPTRVSSHQHP